MADSSIYLTVMDILKSPHFKHSKVIAGNGGLTRIVKWAHILDITQSKEYVNGYDFILTTGAGWKSRKDAINYLIQLIEKNVSALCIQLGLEFNEFRVPEDIPAEMLRAADSHNFPLIIFPEDHKVRYIDLMHYLHTLIINQDYKVFLESEKFLQQYFCSNSILFY